MTATVVRPIAPSEKCAVGKHLPAALNWDPTQRTSLSRVLTGLQCQAVLLVGFGMQMGGSRFSKGLNTVM